MRYLLYQCPSYYKSFLYWPSSFDTQKSFKGSYFPMLSTSFSDKRGGWIPLTCSIMYLFETVIFTSIEIMLKVITAMNSLSHLMEVFYIYFIQMCFNHFLISDLCMHAQVSQHMFWVNIPGRVAGVGESGVRRAGDASFCVVIAKNDQLLAVFWSNKFMEYWWHRDNALSCALPHNICITSSNPS